MAYNFLKKLNYTGDKVKTILLIAALIFSSSVMAAKPVCHETSGGFCVYKGKVERIYINSHNMMLIYFDTPLTLADANIAGYTITYKGAASFNVDENPDFAKSFYSTALAAQATNRNVTIQMRGTYAGYLKFDRIWLDAEG